jgi:hypothetical protein
LLAVDKRLIDFSGFDGMTRAVLAVASPPPTLRLSHRDVFGATTAMANSATAEVAFQVLDSLGARHAVADTAYEAINQMRASDARASNAEDEASVAFDQIGNHLRKPWSGVNPSS